MEQEFDKKAIFINNSGFSRKRISTYFYTLFTNTHMDMNTPNRTIQMLYLLICLLVYIYDRNGLSHFVSETVLGRIWKTKAVYFFFRSSSFDSKIFHTVNWIAKLPWNSFRSEFLFCWKMKMFFFSYKFYKSRLSESALNHFLEQSCILAKPTINNNKINFSSDIDV